MINYAQLRNKTANLQPINEAVYFGKTPSVLKIEKYCGDLIEALRKDPILTGSKLVDEAIRNLENSIAEHINAESVFIEMSPTIATVVSWKRFNDFLFFQDFKNNRTKTTKDGVKFINSKGKLITIVISPIVLTFLTPAELTAVLLHEVGHNLEIQDWAVVGAMVDLFTNPIFMIQVYGVSTIIGLTAYVISKMPPAGRKVFHVAAALASLPFTALDFAKQLISKISPARIEQVTDIAKIAISGRLNVPALGMLIFSKSITGYDGEKYSDAYATSFGYGPDLHTALKKITLKQVNKDLNKIPLFKYYQYLSDLCSSILRYITAPHPQEYNRMMLTIEYLEQAIEDNNNPRMKELMKDDIKEIKKLVKEMKDDPYEPFITKMRAEKSIDTGEFKSEDFREALSTYKGWQTGSLK